MTFWFAFWTVLFAIAGAGFALIALVVAILGVGDLRRMFAALDKRRAK